MTWGLLLSIQPLFLAGQKTLAPLISLGVFGPALVSIGLSAILKPRPREGSRKPAVISFIVVWMLASLIIILQLTNIAQMDLSTSLAVVAVITGLLPAVVASSAFSTIPGVRALLSTYLKPRGAIGYYLLALVLFPAIWLLGNLLSRALGMEVPFLSYTVDGKLLGMVIITFLYGIIYAGLSEEPGWRGFALPRLLQKYSPTVASLILGIIWGLWHLPSFFVSGLPQGSIQIPVFFLGALALSIAITWVFIHTKGSIFFSFLLHYAFNFSLTIIAIPFLHLTLLQTALALIIMIFFGWDLGRSRMLCKGKGVSE